MYGFVESRHLTCFTRAGPTQRHRNDKHAPFLPVCCYTDSANGCDCILSATAVVVLAFCLASFSLLSSKSSAGIRFWGTGAPYWLWDAGAPYWLHRSFEGFQHFSTESFSVGKCFRSRLRAICGHRGAPLCSCWVYRGFRRGF